MTETLQDLAALLAALAFPVGVTLLASGLLH